MPGLLPIGALLALSAAAGGTTLSGALAWDGLIASERALSGAVVRSESGEQRLELNTDSAPLVIEATLESSSGRESVVWLPVPVADGARVHISSDNRTGLSLGPIQRRDAPVIVAGRAASGVSIDAANTIRTSAGGLPGLAQAYAHVRAVVIDGETVSRMSEAQLRALTAYLGGCGRVVLIDTNPTVVDFLRRQAGCGGGTLRAADGATSARYALGRLLETSAAPLPDRGVLERLLPEGSQDLRLISRYLLGFLALFLVLAALEPTRVASVALCPAAMLVAALIWQGGARQDFVAWAEVADGDGVARYAGLGVASARGRGLQSLTLDELGREVRRIDGGPAKLSWSPDPAERRLIWQGSLLQRLLVSSEGSFPVEPNLRAGIRGETAVVCNRGAGRTPPSTLYWRGSAYALPPLAPGQDWSAGNEPPLASPGPELKLLSRRAGELAVLQPLVVPGNGSRRRAWLMRAESAAAEESPCRG